MEAYDALRDYDLFSDEVQRLLIRGVSTRDFSELTEKLDEDLPLSKSSASRAFQRSGQHDLDEINGRDLSGDTFCCIMIDGIEKGRSHVVVALGFTTKGSKKILGLREGATENSEVVKDLIQSLIDRGLCTTPYILFVLDGAKALRKAVKAHWGERAIVQRCQEHKIRNVRSYLLNDLQDELERRMRAAYGTKRFDEALAAMKKIIVNNSMRGSLRIVLARLSLRSTDPDRRRLAVKLLFASLTPETPMTLREVITEERNPDVLEALRVALALADPESTDTDRPLRAIDALAAVQLLQLVGRHHPLKGHCGADQKT